MKYTTTNKKHYITANLRKGLRKNIIKIYNYMSASLMLTGFIAILTVDSEYLLSKLYVINDNEIIGFLIPGWLVIVAPVGIAMAFSLKLFKMTALTAQILFWSYSILLGLSLSSIFFLYAAESIGAIFLITASVFGFMSMYGHITKANLSSVGYFLIMGLIGILIASMVNSFLLSSGIHFILSIIVVLIFTGLTAFNTQRIKNMHIDSYEKNKLKSKIIIISALTLYLDFINIFIRLLGLFVSRKGR